MKQEQLDNFILTLEEYLSVLFTEVKVNYESDWAEGGGLIITADMFGWKCKTGGSALFLDDETNFDWRIICDAIEYGLVNDVKEQIKKQREQL